MSLKPLLSFSSGELDPVLTDNVTLEKFNKGLATARNVFIGKTGSVFSRFSRKFCVNAKNNNEAIKLYQPPNTTVLLEWGPLYVRVYGYDNSYQTPAFDGNADRGFDLGLVTELAHPLNESTIPNLNFTTSKNFVYAFSGYEVLKLNLDTFTFVSSADKFKIPDPLEPTVNVTAFGAPTGYKVDYLVTMVIDGQETLSKQNVTGFNKPLAAGQSNRVGVSWLKTAVPFSSINEIRVYSRPNAGGAFGYLGSTTPVSGAGLYDSAAYEDLGSLPDYSNGTQDIITKYGLAAQEIKDLGSRTGVVYQQRLILTSSSDREALIASRPGFQNNFYRDFPYASDSSLLFKAGTSGKAEVLRLIESDGLIVFTTNGVYISGGLLSVNNLALERKGGWIIKNDLPPLVVPGGLFFVDTNNTIRQMIFSQDILAYESIEQTIFSNHLFKNRTIKSWTFQDGIAPLIIVVFNDGDFATFTYNYEHQMKAWTRHDSKYPVEQVEYSGNPNRTWFVTNKNGQRSIEVTLPRVTSADEFLLNSEISMSAPTAFMDAIKVTSYRMNNFNEGFEYIPTEEYYIATPVTPGDWGGLLSITTGTGVPNINYTVGTILRFFHPVDQSSIDVEVMSIVSPTNIRVQPSDTFPSEYAGAFSLYATYTTITGLSHLNGEDVSIMVDGFLVASPNNDVEGYPTVTVSGGSLTLPSGLRGAIVHVGRPITADIKTLNVSTVEQSPTLIESLNVNKVYVRVNDSRGIYISSKFPEEENGEVDGSSVEDMDNLDVALIPSDVIIGNRFLAPVSMRSEKIIPGTWDTQGQVSIRQVDPFHFEILSIILDAEVLPRRN